MCVCVCGGGGEEGRRKKKEREKREMTHEWFTKKSDTQSTLFNVVKIKLILACVRGVNNAVSACEASL